MAGGVADSVSYWLLALWVAGVVVLGFALAYGTLKAGRLRRTERERSDRNSQANRQMEESETATSGTVAPPRRGVQ
jgi:beta-lactamase regulating signal transducer with metallopeptidase domain